MSDIEATQARPATVGQALQFCSESLAASDVYFGHGTDNPWDEAVQMVLAVAALPPDAGGDVLPLPLDDAAWDRLRRLLHRRIHARIPLPYLLGRAWFAGLQLRCDERAIIPRSPLAELILNEFRPWYSGPPPRRALDLCCGGGCIGLAAAHYMPQLTVDLLDIDPHALQLAAENIAQLQLGARVRALHSDLFQAVEGMRYDLILSNPPYVNAADLAAMPAEFRCEPAIALAAGTDGLALAHRILAGAAAVLHDTGLLVMEVGNSAQALEQAYPRVPFTWVEFEHGGHGVLVLSARELQDYSASWRG
ncbi:MAG: 50S ribosomal protein L3 N(5)-glutamine methyltransferase [Halioglobus sp.]|nr:50S ribosomal protein L3 N(5)-glutamine methyltransferase [Halioglobus sp.]